MNEGAIREVTFHPQTGQLRFRLALDAAPSLEAANQALSAFALRVTNAAMEEAAFAFDLAPSRTREGDGYLYRWSPASDAATLALNDMKAGDAVFVAIVAEDVAFGRALSQAFEGTLETVHPIELGPPAGAKVQAVQHNFSGRGGEERIYAVTGTTRPFEWDGTRLRWFKIAIETEHPRLIAAWADHLWLGYEGARRSGPIRTAP